MPFPYLDNVSTANLALELRNRMVRETKCSQSSAENCAIQGPCGDLHVIITPLSVMFPGWSDGAIGSKPDFPVLPFPSVWSGFPVSTGKGVPPDAPDSGPKPEPDWQKFGAESKLRSVRQFLGRNSPPPDNLPPPIPPAVWSAKPTPAPAPAIPPSFGGDEPALPETSFFVVLESGGMSQLPNRSSARELASAKLREYPDSDSFVIFKAVSRVQRVVSPDLVTNLD